MLVTTGVRRVTKNAKEVERRVTKDATAAKTI